MSGVEVNFDGLVGPTHNYAGLSYGNVASKQHAKGTSQPKAAAQQGLRKMQTVAELGLPQGVLAPNARPDINILRRLGFSGSDTQVINKVAKTEPALLATMYSASSMWTANAATVSPSADTADGKVHFTPANLNNKLHRSIEPSQTGAILKSVFSDEVHFAHHTHLPEQDSFGDEGAANHTRFCVQYDQAGIEFFVYGRSTMRSDVPAPTKFPARHTLEASQAVARLHGLNENQCVFALQNPDVIDQGVFHNDVIAVGNQNALFYHEQAFHNTEQVKAELAQKGQAVGIKDMHFIEVPTVQVSVEDAVKSYLFNTQLLTINHGQDDAHMVLMAPTECRENTAVHAYLSKLTDAATPIEQVHYLDVKQSMKNGGGPACLRLRVALSQAQLKAVNPKCLLTSEQFEVLYQWVDKHYRDELAPADLADPSLLTESYTALDELTQILGLGSVYSFQQD